MRGGSQARAFSPLFSTLVVHLKQFALAAAFSAPGQPAAFQLLARVKSRSAICLSSRVCKCVRGRDCRQVRDESHFTKHNSRPPPSQKGVWQPSEAYCQPTHSTAGGPRVLRSLWAWRPLDADLKRWASQTLPSVLMGMLRRRQCHADRLLASFTNHVL